MSDDNHMTEQPGAIVIKPHQRTYEDPITLVKGDTVKITRRDLWNGQYVWVWCINNADKQGWVPESFVRIHDDNGIALRDYNAIELTVSEGETLIVLEKTHGWYWVQNRQGQQGWVPVENVKIAPV